MKQGKEKSNRGCDYEQVTTVAAGAWATGYFQAITKHILEFSQPRHKEVRYLFTNCCSSLLEGCSRTLCPPSTISVPLVWRRVIWVSGAWRRKLSAHKRLMSTEGTWDASDRVCCSIPQNPLGPMLCWLSPVADPSRWWFIRTSKEKSKKTTGMLMGQETVSSCAVGPKAIIGSYHLYPPPLV